MTIIYDAGLLIGAERSDRQIWADHRARLERGLTPFTTALVVAQVSRSARQAQLRRLLRGCEILPFTPQDAHPVGELLAKANTSDVVDAHLALTASQTGAVVLTGDFEDLTHLASFLQPKPEVRAILS